MRAAGWRMGVGASGNGRVVLRFDRAAARGTALFSAPTVAAASDEATPVSPGDTSTPLEPFTSSAAKGSLPRASRRRSVDELVPLVESGGFVGPTPGEPLFLLPGLPQHVGPASSMTCIASSDGSRVPARRSAGPTCCGRPGRRRSGSPGAGPMSRPRSTSETSLWMPRLRKMRRTLRFAATEGKGGRRFSQRPLGSRCGICHTSS